ncbi:Replication fork clamp-binding protein CrfC (dynamin-like GTPase family) [Marinobacter daqiaonensis]|uniref:Replication fork clamp-binding protein CrfC (Dynamin-like GTPase family) n=1 Tax=Marinobacter daqiaonensis TaxID=650891 RepID=A0A1I6JV05_9GAMM|nr:dynamin family protein [Marinobacter daqiaonensis]SFR82819.1 Replication fork clamp-binding protein CrfC (dynamin-like GTPase family) [Marinobacter daqiaonensis]
MNGPAILAHQVEAYHQWKKELIRQISRYRLWLQDNDLYSDDVSERIRRGVELLIDDELTIAFVGEYSRGKTELINALFFSEYGQRLLPSEAGRTTMCPTELYFDRTSGSNYLQLLPIDTREGDLSLQQLRKRPELWIRYELDEKDPDAMRAVLAEVARVRSVSHQQARKLGFSESMLEADRDNPGQVLIPSWRSARISIRHPLFERGLRILDTPGLNALGSEPELTVSLLPAAHAILFLLSADTGVTASDMTIWKEHIDTDDADHRAGRFAVLNKIDTLWDELRAPEEVRNSIDRVCHYTANQLGLKDEDVIPVSAKQGLTAKAKGNDALLTRSELPNLERLLVGRILKHKEELITQSLINDLLGMLQNSQAAMQARLENLEEELGARTGTSVDREALRRLADRAQNDYDFYYRKLITLRSSRRLMQSQGDILTDMVSEARFETHAETVRQMMAKSWTSAGMSKAMDHFFELLESDLQNLLAEGRLAERMVEAIYRRYNQDTRARHLEPIPLRAGRHVIAVRELRKRATRFRRAPGNLLREQNQLIRRFFQVMVTEARTLHERVRRDVERWPGEALLPIMQYSMEQKQLLEHQVRRIRDMVRNDRDSKVEKERLINTISDLRRQLELADTMQRQIRRPAPTLSQQKVVNISGIA